MAGKSRLIGQLASGFPSFSFPDCLDSPVGVFRRQAKMLSAALSVRRRRKQLIDGGREKASMGRRLAKDQDGEIPQVPWLQDLHWRLQGQLHFCMLDE